MKLRPAIFLLLLTAGAFLVQGYHPWAEDAAYYIPPVIKLLHPSSYPYGAEFFESHASLTLFPNLMAASVRISHLPLDVVLLAWQALCMYLFLLGCWKVAGLCFEEQHARWCAVTLEAALLTLPVAGTALFLMDQFVNPRSFSAFAAMFAVAAALENRYVAAVLWLLGAGLIHPLMPAYGIFFVALLAWYRPRETQAMAAAASLLVLGITFGPPTQAYHQATLAHSYHYVQRWPWYGWLGILAPVALFYWFAVLARNRGMKNVERLCRSLVPFVLVSLAAALVLDLPQRYEALARFQPMRSLHLAYALLVLLLGGMAGQFVLKRRAARWVLLFVPLCAGMTYVQLRLFPDSAHIEWPGASRGNEWVQAFDWIRRNTPRDAYFAMDPMYMERPGEDEQSFRAIAQRSSLADEVKDSGSVTMFPELAEEWWEQVSALEGWKKFQAGDFSKLKARFGIDWVILEQPGVPGLACPYRNSRILVCRVS